MDQVNKHLPKKLNNISFLRLVMCIGIFVFHYISFFVTPEIDYYFPSPVLVFVFAFLSAFLYSTKNITNPKEWIKKNVLKLLIPTLVYVIIASLIIIIVGVIIYYFDFSQVFQGFTGINPSNGASNMAFGNLWFLGILLLCYIATPFCSLFVNKSLSKKGNIIFLISIILLCLLEVSFNFFCPVFSVYVASFFIGRRIFKPVCQDEPTKEHFPLVIAIITLLIISSVSWYLFVGKLEGNYLDIHIKMLKYFVLYAYSLSLGSLLLYCFKFLNKFNMPLFKITDTYSFPFYMAHQMYMVGTLCFYSLIPTWYFVPLFFLTCITSYIVMLVSNLISNKVLIKNK